jgi:hypothetical protein
MRRVAFLYYGKDVTFREVLEEIRRKGCHLFIEVAAEEFRSYRNSGERSIYDAIDKLERNTYDTIILIAHGRTLETADADQFRGRVMLGSKEHSHDEKDLDWGELAFYLKPILEDKILIVFSCKSYHEEFQEFISQQLPLYTIACPGEIWLDDAVDGILEFLNISKDWSLCELLNNHEEVKAAIKEVTNDSMKCWVKGLDESTD